ncbi:CRP-like cAMP-binding protein [Nocardia transvalensis]|uniref:CRP-like cAMP-binding protein n=1 Tax=Nocardia transvalensis TaxID=37333 RepID=A0A7W9PII8_9NOCA|nr:cyclic nucleotide-binding domain-containing protein [Nocardia transvalensis]MBB5916730.1 CRP-like cAMP-binding protein [Nocardia transvalensis]
MTTAEELTEFAHLATLDDAELATLAAAGHDVSYPPGHRLIVEGEAADRCWLIRDGHVLLDAHVPGRGDLTVQTLGRGDLLGWSWLVPPYRWRFGARTLDAVRAIEFDSAALATFADADPMFGRALATMLFEAVLERLQATRARLLDLYRNPADPRSGPPRSGAGR